MDSITTQADLAALLNDPELIRRHAPAIARKLAAGIMAVPNVVVLGDTDGMVVFYPEGGGAYDMHYLFPKWARGKEAVDRIKAFMRCLFMEYGATRISGETPIDNLAARRVNRMVGGVPVSIVYNADAGGQCIKYTLTKDRFLQLFPDNTT